MCVAISWRRRNFFVAVARLLCFDFAADGVFDDEKLNFFKSGEPFPVKITIRSVAYQRLIQEEAEKVEGWKL